MEIKEVSPDKIIEFFNTYLNQKCIITFSDKQEVIVKIVKQKDFFILSNTSRLDGTQCLDKEGYKYSWLVVTKNDLEFERIKVYYKFKTKEELIKTMFE